MRPESDLTYLGLISLLAVLVVVSALAIPMPSKNSYGLFFVVLKRPAKSFRTTALRHQLAVYQPTVSRACLRPTDRLLWA